jgi:hypothetical protein
MSASLRGRHLADPAPAGPRCGTSPLEHFHMYVAIEGVIGVGKTTLARLLQSAFNAEILLEIFEENPFLSEF